MTQDLLKRDVGKPALSMGGNLACIVSIIFFAFGFPAAEVLLETWGSVALIAVRTVMAIVLLIPIWIAVDGWATVKSAPWLRGMWIGGLGFGIGATTILIAQSMTDPVTAALAVAMMPVAAVALEVLFDGRRLSMNFLMGVFLVLMGGIVASGANITDGQFGFGAILGVCSTFIFAWGSRKTVKSLPMMSNIGQTTVTLIGAMLLCQVTFAIFLMMGWKGTHFATLDGNGWIMLMLFAWSALAVSHMFWILGVKKVGVGVASFHLNAVPFYVMLILLAMGESWDWGQTLGASFVAIGVIMAQRKSQWTIVPAE